MVEGRDAQIVYLLWHSRPLNDHPETPETDDKLLGVFDSEAEAEAAKAVVLGKPGFRDWPEAFEISRYTINQREWIDGFGWDEAANRL